MQQFRPQAILLYTCVVRKTLWKDLVDLEMLPFAQMCCTGGFHTWGEIIRGEHTGKLCEHNVTILSIGLREGEPQGEPIEVRIDDTALQGQASLLNRMTRMVYAAMDYAERLRLSVCDHCFPGAGHLTIKAAMRGCHYWVITPDAHWKCGDVPQPASAFSMDHGAADGIFRARLRGRMDTITAPELLKAWEAQKRTMPITTAEIDCSGLQYISSAGLRVLLIMQKDGARVRLTGVVEAVWEILETTGFLDIFEVEKKVI